MRNTHAFVLSLCLCSSVCAQTVGDKVFTIEKAELKNSAEVVGTTEFGDLLEIELIEGNWFLVNNKGTRGWISRKKVALPEKAVQEFTRKIQAEPKNSRNYHMRATARYHLGQRITAIADWTEAINLQPHEIYFYNRGSVRIENGDFDDAISDFDEAIRANPRGVYYYASRGIAFNAKGNYAKAISDFDRAIELAPSFFIAINARGNAWQNKGEYEKAIADFNEVLRINPKFSIAYNNRGNARALLMEYDNAIADYTEAIRLDPQYVAPYNGRGWLYATCPLAKFRNASQAVKDATKACELSDWKVANNIGTLAAAYAESGDFMNAVNWQQKAMNLARENEKSDYRSRLDLYKSGQPYRQTVK